jgi:hypothetical protein
MAQSRVHLIFDPSVRRQLANYDKLIGLLYFDAESLLLFGTDFG